MPSNREFLVLQKKWDQKLAKTGFSDIEDRRTQQLRNWNYSNYTYKRDKEEYYRLAAQYLHVARFKSKMHKKVWSLFCQGYTQLKIGRQLKLSGVREGRRKAQAYIEDVLVNFNAWCARR